MTADRSLHSWIKQSEPRGDGGRPKPCWYRFRAILAPRPGSADPTERLRQAAAGRMESGVEIRDNVAAFPCGEVLLDRSRRRISRREAAERLREILAE